MIAGAVQTLAERVDRAWGRCGYRDDAFADVAAQALREPGPLTFANVVRALFAGEIIPEQRRSDEGFGQPALTLHCGTRFDIEMLCWRDATPAIHEHGFFGAFRLLEGASLQGRFRFAVQGRLGTLETGRLERIAFERLVPGAVTPIRAGADMIHANFHLVDPGVTLVVRTHQMGRPERTFLPPGLAYDSAVRSPALHKRLQMLDTLDAVGSRGYVAAVRDVVARGDGYETLAILMRAGGHATAQPYFEEFCAQARSLHGDVGGVLVAAVEAERRRGMLVRMRRTVTGEGSRLAIACLMECRDSDDFADLLAAATAASQPPEGLDLIAGLVQPAEGERPIARMALAGLIAGLSAQAFVEAASGRSEAPLDHAQRAGLMRYYDRLHAVPWLAPLIRRQAVPA